MTVSTFWAVLGIVGIACTVTSVFALAVILLHDLYSHRSQRR